MRAALARHLRALADRLVGHAELDALRLDVRRLQTDLAIERRRCAAEYDYVERLLAERDALQRQGAAWLCTAGDLSDAVSRRGAAVVAPVFGRRVHPPHLRLVD